MIPIYNFICDESTENLVFKGQFSVSLHEVLILLFQKSDISKF